MFENLTDRLESAFKKLRGHGRLTEENIQEAMGEVRTALLEADVNFGVVKEFIAAAGVGLTSQYLEQFGRKLLGGLLGKVAGKTIGSVGRAATGMAFTFATTYALGHLAKRYYAGGRSMNQAMLRDTFDNLLEPAKQMQAQYLPQIQQKAKTLDVSQIMTMVRS